MILWGGRALAACVAVGVASAQEPTLHTWRLEHGRLECSEGVSDAPLAVGSLQKPFVARAWAQAHPDAPTPRFSCSGGGACWLKQGHGDLGLATALARSCNAYFRQLAEATPTKALAESLGAAGFAPAPTNPDEAIGLAAPKLLRIRPARVLEAYGELLREPWPLGEGVRQEVLRGLRESARTGTAGGLGAWGTWAKTGTVPLDAQHTVGFAVALEEGGAAVLARLRPGTGSQAATALAAPLAKHRPSTPVPVPTRDSVTVRLFDLLPASAFSVRNLGTTPIPDGRGFLGPGASRLLHPGDRVGPGPLELRADARGLRRRFRGRLQVAGGRLLATLARRDYTEGVLAAELPHGSLGLRLELGAAVQRFLTRGRRHVDADVCDSTHCAWFVGQGPRLDWTDPTRARETREADPAPLSDAEWERMVRLGQMPGPALWSAHCGGAPLSARRVWGWGEATAVPCARHTGPSATWVRTWRRAEVERAFGPEVDSIALAPEAGVWGLILTRRGVRKTLGFDEAHRRIAGVLGWDALPSPADRLEVTTEGVRLHGAGSGHRVGLCLSE
ncbi:MAG TPA: hypothetical protein VJ505_00050 [Holophagaceae bacterium]|nr:hypothetical protein [Holophagaceae bacterium]